MPSSILNSDDGVISGTSGLKSSGGDDGNLVFQSKGTETARINTDSQIVAAAGTASLPALTTTGDVNTGIFFPAADTIAFAEGGAEAMRIDSSGNVGIGTTSVQPFKVHASRGSMGSYPTWETTVARNIGLFETDNGEGYVAIGAPTDGYSQISFADPGAKAAGAIGYAHATDHMLFRTNATERARITSDGEFLINATSNIFAGRVLQAKRSGGGVAILKVEGSVGSEVLFMWNNATSGNNLFQEFGTENSLVVRGSIDYNRGAGLVRYNTSSDATLKNIIGDSDGAKSVEILNSTRIREFAWKDDPAQKPQIGVIAQELYETYKGAVSVGGNHEETIPAVTEQRLVSEAVLDENGNEIEAAVYETVEVEPERKETKYRPWGVDKTAFTFHLVAGWQAHEKLIKQQAETIAALEARIAALEAVPGNE
jgi:hypothetical protein